MGGRLRRIDGAALTRCRDGRKNRVEDQTVGGGEGRSPVVGALAWPRWSRSCCCHLVRLRRLQRRLHRARDLRRRRQHHPRRGRQDRRRQGRRRSVGHAHADSTRRRSCCTSKTPASRTSAPTRAARSDPQALIGEKFVNCLPTQPRAEGTPLPPPLRKIPAGHEGAGSTCCRSRTLKPRRRRPAQRHQPPARGAASDDHPQRTRRRPRRARQRPERGHPPRRPRAARTRQGARRSSPARTTCSPTWPTNPTARWRRSPVSNSRSRASSSEQHRRQAQRPTSAARSSATSPASRRSSNSSGPRWNGSGASPNRPRRPSPTSKAAAPGINETFTHLPPFSNSSTDVLPEPRQDRQGLRAGARRAAAAAGSAEDAGQRRQAVRSNLAELFTSLRDTGRPRALHGLHLPRRRLDQRLRRARALPARGSGRPTSA